MSLTVGTGPFGHAPAGRFDFEPPRAVLYFEDFPRRIRARFAGETVVDSVRVKLLHESGLLPVYYFPEADVRADLLAPGARSSHDARKGPAAFFSVRVGERVAPDAAWTHPEPLAGGPDLRGFIAFYWSAMDEWLEEDEQAIGHARDPYHRVDVLDTSRHVRVSVAGHVLAETTRARVLFETGLPPRWYIPPADVRQDVLVASDSRTICAYKGTASYWSVRAADAVDRDLVWYYTDPRHDALRVAGYLCFFNERVDLEIDGVRQPRPRTPWSRDAGEEYERVEAALRWPAR
jgi:uncharacterized protein (DUF427 family)